MGEENISGSSVTTLGNPRGAPPLWRSGGRAPSLFIPCRMLECRLPPCGTRDTYRARKGATPALMAAFIKHAYPSFTNYRLPFSKCVFRRVTRPFLSPPPLCYFICHGSVSSPLLFPCRFYMSMPMRFAPVVVKALP